MNQESTAGPQAILVVEDEAMLLMIISETLRDAGFTVFEASNGYAAVDLLKTHPEITLLFSDIKMPGMSGYQVVEQGLTLIPNLKVVLTTGYAQDPVPSSFLEAQIEVLYKPFNFDVLPDLARGILKA